MLKNVSIIHINTSKKKIISNTFNCNSCNGRKKVKNNEKAEKGNCLMRPHVIIITGCNRCHRDGKMHG